MYEANCLYCWFLLSWEKLELLIIFDHGILQSYPKKLSRLYLAFQLCRKVWKSHVDDFCNNYHFLCCSCKQKMIFLPQSCSSRYVIVKTFLSFSHGLHCSLTAIFSSLDHEKFHGYFPSMINGTLQQFSGTVIRILISEFSPVNVLSPLCYHCNFSILRTVGHNESQYMLHSWVLQKSAIHFQPHHFYVRPKIK